MEYLLSLIIACPLVACLFVFLFDDGGAKRFGRIISFIELGLVLWLFFIYRIDVAEVQFLDRFVLIEPLGIDYIVSVDGISLALIMLTAFIMFIANIYVRRLDDSRPLVVCLLSLEGILMGLFLSQNALMFYTFWELALLPVLYMVGVWGTGKKIYIGMKFFVYTFASSLVMLMSIIYMGYLYYSTYGIFSFDMYMWKTLNLPLSTQSILFWGFLISIAVKIPIIPLHTWLPHIYSEAPALGSVMLSALLSKMGTYAMLKILLPIFPDASVSFMPMVTVLAVVMVIYAGIIAFRQRDIKKVIAYSSISHMGVVILGIFSFNPEGISGAVFMMVAHGITSGGLFLLAGMLFYRMNTRHIDDFGGIASVMPHYSTLFAVVMLSNVGLPLTIGFVGEFLSLYGFFQTSAILTALAGTTVIISACYMLYMFKNIFYGDVIHASILKLKDLNFREYATMIPLIAAIVAFGIYPKVLLEFMQTTSQQVISTMNARATEDSSKEHFLKVNNGLILSVDDYLFENDEPLEEEIIEPQSFNDRERQNLYSTNFIYSKPLENNLGFRDSSHSFRMTENQDSTEDYLQNQDSNQNQDLLLSSLMATYQGNLRRA